MCVVCTRRSHLGLGDRHDGGGEREEPSAPRWEGRVDAAKSMRWGGEEILRPSPVDTVCRCLIVRRERARGLGRPSTEYSNE